MWISKDGIPVVAHCATDGVLTDYGYPAEFIYDWTVEQLKKLDAGEEETIPTFEEVLQVFQGHVFINIELKAPRS